MQPVSRIPVPRVKRSPAETTYRVALGSPSQQKAARTGRADSPGRMAPTVLQTPPQRQERSRLSMYGVPLSMDSSRRGGRRMTVAGELAGEKRIVVCARKRPLSGTEARANAADCVQIDMATNAVKITTSRTKLDGLSRYEEAFDFAFDRVYDLDCPNSLVYRQIVRPLAEFALSGGKATCFAYGQTGSGKTHTMFHPRDGLCYSGAAELIERAGALTVGISFFEIYQSQLYDLLRDRRRVMPCEKADGQVKIMGLEEEVASSIDEAREAIQRGLATRMTGKTGANSQSSRSHAILQFTLRSADGSSVFGRMSFIDLAGSERGADRADVDRKTKLEGSEINKSLLALKECIRAIDMDAAHLPFRQSKLTLVLKDSIVGDVRTAMIATVSPSAGSCEHTLNTLRYAERFHEISGGTAVRNENHHSGSWNGVASDWTVSPASSAKVTPSMPRTVTFASQPATPQQHQAGRMAGMKQKVLGTIDVLKQQVTQCTDMDIIELLGEELVTLTQAFQTLA